MDRGKSLTIPHLFDGTNYAKEAWTILQNTYEGTKAVKNSKLQRSFEEIMMDDDESFDELYAKLNFSIQSWR